ncbi:hypothetical protein HDV02_006101 [Globomyces sp. JEL0801]|nr:hypothetical protein HDV02_006101 [Globomyces sp. JEL0801]
MLTKPKVLDISETNIAGLGTELEKETYQKPDDPTKLLHDVHFWLGLETTQDEAGTAAYKTVELDTFLLGLPVQHREVQGAESKLFLSYFKKLVIMAGGIETGFKHVGPKEYRSRLLQISGANNRIVVREVPKTRDSLNDSDCFILDMGLQIYQFNGEKASGQEKHKAMEYAHAVAGERKSAIVKVFEQNDSDATPFWDGVGGKGPVRKVDPKQHLQQTKKTLLKVSDSTGPLTTTVVAQDASIKKSLLSSDDVFILDSGIDVYIWVGKNASAQEKASALEVAMKYLVENNKPPTTHISRILEGGDNQEFNASFS